MKQLKWYRLIGSVFLTASLVPLAFAADETPSEPKTEVTVEPTKGFVTFKSGDNSLTLGAWGDRKSVV